MENYVIQKFIINLDRYANQECLSMKYLKH
nr:MAG TPA: Protein of unknown function (DUF3195) [Bacteriophage sp.]